MFCTFVITSRVTAENLDVETAETGRDYWAFQPITRPDVPDVDRARWVRNAIDNFVVARLEEKGLEPGAPTDRRSLIRRAFFDLIGLPPSPEEVDAFVNAKLDDAYEDLIDDLLARPQFGERWGRHWLDVVRFAQTNGFEKDWEKVSAWRFRDYVIKSLNDDKPFDRFILEQLAGDEFDDMSPETVIATGYYRVGPWDNEPPDMRTAKFDELDDIVRTTGTAFLGLSIGCARCHDHMFDAITQQDYYEFSAFFSNITSYGMFRDTSQLDPNPKAIFLPILPADKLVATKKKWDEDEHEAKELMQQLRDEHRRLNQHGLKEDPEAAKRRSEIVKQVRELEEFLTEPEFGWALSVTEKEGNPEPVHVLVRGDPENKGIEVQPAVLSVLEEEDGDLTVEDVSLDIPLRQALIESGVPPTTGRRLTLAKWIASPQNPLTARVYVNRIWQHLMGQGIVRTPDNFGQTGARPTHPQLLDWLASECLVNDWKPKGLIKTIMLSQTYQMSSRVNDARANAVDPVNNLFWRQRPRRLEAEAIRDSILAVSGELNTKMGGRGFFPELADEVIATIPSPEQEWTTSSKDERNRRSIYIFSKRSMVPPMLATFDCTNTSESVGERTVTTVAPQALLLLNHKFSENKAGDFAERVAREAGSDRDRRIDRVFRLALGRNPNEGERLVAHRLMRARDEQTPDARNSALRSLCLVTFNLNEFVYVD